VIVGSFKLPVKTSVRVQRRATHRRIELSPIGHSVRLVAEVPMRTQHVFRRISMLAQRASFAVVAFSIEAADSGIITFQESSAPSSENSSVLIGHWRKTTISYTGPIDEHLVLHSDGTVENWTATAYERREPVTGHWSVEGKTLTLSFGGNDRSNPFTFYQGQLVFPNIQNRRGFWEKIE
jgi:hypothetical protein